MQDKEFSQALELLRFPLALMVVILHVFAWSSTIDSGWEHLDTFRMVNYARAINIAAFADTRVPLYFFMAGYFFFKVNAFTPDVYFRKLRNRVHSLLIPYILWNTISIAIIIMVFGLLYRNDSVSKLNISVSSILNCYWIYDGALRGKPVALYGFPLDGPLWFVRNLMIVVITTPLLYICLKRAGKLLLSLLGIVWIFQHYLPNPFVTSFITAYFFFSLGGYISIGRVNIIAILRKRKYLLYAIYIACSIFLFLYMVPTIGSHYKGYPSCKGAGLYVYRFMSIIGILCLLLIADQLVSSEIIKPSKFLAKISFFIYAGHLIILGYLMQLIWMILSPATELQTLGFYILSFVLLVAMMIGTYIAMQKVCPRFLRLLSGGRSSL